MPGQPKRKKGVEVDIKAADVKSQGGAASSGGSGGAGAALDHTSAVFESGKLAASLLDGVTYLSGPVPFSGEGMISANNVELFGPNVSEVRKSAVLTTVFPKDETKPALMGELVSSSDTVAQVKLTSGTRVKIPYASIYTPAFPLNRFAGAAPTPAATSTATATAAPTDPLVMKLTYNDGITYSVVSHIAMDQAAEPAPSKDAKDAKDAKDGKDGKAAMGDGGGKKEGGKEEWVVVQSLELKSELPYNLSVKELSISFQGQHHAPRRSGGGSRGGPEFAMAAAAAPAAVDSGANALKESAAPVSLGPFKIIAGETVTTKPLRKVRIQLLETFNDLNRYGGKSISTVLKMIPLDDTLLPSTVNFVSGSDKSTTLKAAVPLRKPGETFEMNVGERNSVVVEENETDYNTHAYRIVLKSNAPYPAKMRLNGLRLVPDLAPGETRTYTGKYT